MGAAPHHPTAVHDQNLISIHHRGEPMSDGHHGRILSQLGDGLLDRSLCQAIHLGGGLVQQQHQRAGQQCPRQGDALPLAAGDAGLGQRSVQPFGQGSDLVGQMRPLQYGVHLILVRLRIGEEQVLAD